MAAQPFYRGSGLVLAVLLLAALACSLDSSPDQSSSVRMENRPLVLLLAPVNNSTYAAGTRVEFHAIAQESAGVARIEFRVDETPLVEVQAETPGGQPSLVARATWTAAGVRGHLVTAEAFRTDGSTMGTADVAVNVVETPGKQPAGDTAASPNPTPGVQPTSIPTPTQGPTSVDQGILSGPVARANQDGVNVRQGPGTAYTTVGTLSQGQAVQLVGRSNDGAWWAVSYSGGTAWVFTQLVVVEGDVSSVPLVAAP